MELCRGDDAALARVGGLEPAKAGQALPLENLDPAVEARLGMTGGDQRVLRLDPFGIGEAGPDGRFDDRIQGFLPLPLTVREAGLDRPGPAGTSNSGSRTSWRALKRS